MTFLSRNRLLIAGFVVSICVPTAVMALAPVENAAELQGTTGSNGLVPQPGPTVVMGDSNDPNTASVSAAKSQPMATQSSSSIPQDVTDNNPLIGGSVRDPSLSEDSNSSSLPLSTRVARLEQQMQNLVNSDAMQQIDQLKVQLAQLSGKLAVQEHDINLLNSQLRSFYSDLSSQIKQVKNMSGGNGDDTGSGATSSSNVLPDATTPASTSTSETTKPSQSSQQDAAVEASNRYKSALNLLRQKQYAQSSAAFKSYIDDFPNGRFVVNARYWLGEIYAQQGDLKNSIQQFDTVIRQFPHSSKVADAKVKLAIIHASQGQKIQARHELIKIKQMYPDTTAAQLASIQLQSLSERTQ